MANSKHANQIAAVTGGTGAIGRAIAHQLADFGYNVVLITRNKPKSKRTVEEIIRETGNHRVSYQLANLARHTEIEKLRTAWQGPLSILINNAGATPPERLETPEGIEMQFATNVLGYFWMIQEFKDLLKASSPSRVINVASYWAGGLNFADLEFEKRTYRNGAAYRQSKQANRMLTAAFAPRLEDDGITVNACHPGDVNSKLSNNLGFGGHQTPAQGAETPVWLATSDKVKDVTGQYFEHKKQTHCRFMEDKEAVERLFQICARY